MINVDIVKIAGGHFIETADHYIFGKINPQEFKQFSNVATEDDIRSFEKAFKKGKIDPVIINRNEHGRAIVDGQHRVNAARKLGMTDLPAIIIDNHCVIQI